MTFVPGRSGNPKGRPRKGDSLAEAIRSRWNPKQRRSAIDALSKKADGGDVQAFDQLAKRGWPHEAHGLIGADGETPQAVLVRFVDAE